MLGAVALGYQPDATALTPDGTTLLIAHSGSNDLAVVETEGPALTTLVPLGASPRAIAVIRVPVAPGGAR